MVFHLTRRPSKSTYEAPSSVAGYDCEIYVVVLNPDLTFLNRKEKAG